MCNIAIARYATVTVSADDAARPGGVEGRLVQAALRRAGVQADVSIRNDFPVGAGLGGSSAASAALLVGLAELRGLTWERTEIAELGRAMEVEDLGVPGGRQDHYAATYGGALGLTFTNSTAVRRLRISDAVRSELPARSVLVHTGESRISGDTITAVLDAYERGERAVNRALARMKDLARDMAAALERGDLDALGEMLGEHWHHQRSLHPGIPTTRIDEIVSRARGNGGIGAKAMGASGGGCVLVIGRPERMPALRAALAPLGEILDFQLDTEGVAVSDEEAA